MNHVTIRTNLNGRTGYGQLANYIIANLGKLGFSIKCIPLARLFNGQNVPVDVTNLVVPEFMKTSELDLIIGPINFNIADEPCFFGYPPSLRRVHLCMWESSRIRYTWAQMLNDTNAVIVPSEWNKLVFQNDGVVRPIHVVPLYVDTSLYQHSPRSKEELFVVGGGAFLGHGANARKRIPDLIRAFVKAFPGKRDVQLRLKVSNADDIPRYSDPRIQIQREFLTDGQMADWYKSIDVFASLSACEGWGLMQHQAMATGRPVIAAEWGGLSEFFNSEVGFPLDYEMRPATEHYADSGGEWAYASEKHLIEVLRHCYENRDEVERLGKLASERALKLSGENMLEKLAGVLYLYS